MTYEQIVEFNPGLRVMKVTDREFAAFGRLIEDYDMVPLIKYMEEKTEIPQDGNIYRASVPEMESLPVKCRLQTQFYGQMPIQIGYCNGPNSTLNGLEYHMGSEINVAVTDMVLMLGRLQDVENDCFDVARIAVFYVPKGTALQMYETTLHFAPCKTESGGFKCIVILPRGTNEPLDPALKEEGNRLLFARNKWLLAHPQRKPLMEKGAWPGIKGENIGINIG
ncbi:DUF4867 domain-containing protein [Bacteroidia bacterium]|nr:DUF4867 domain-containing protein [Bacteroidia bacterium]